ncbi:MAG: hypothetical protein R3F41_09280 [Gammaproteobacteria bacterium]|nr:hypothetical protein [Pseudomonadales bacterium]MCP5347793.1 hypothetical protein [Pseudomonadales bacterium]
MAAEAIDISRWQETVRQLLSRNWKRVFDGGSQRELLKQVGALILVFDDRVIDLVSGRQSQLADASIPDAESLARTVGEMLELTQEDSSVILLLPPHGFVATSVDMPGMNRDSLLSALRLQSDNLLPSCIEQLAVVAVPHGADDPHPDVALWIPERGLDGYYRAFEQQGLFLSGVMPRSLALMDVVGDQEILDEDRHTLTRILIRNGVIVQWLHISRKDLEQDIFERQWRQALTSPATESQLAINQDNVPEVFEQASTHKLPGSDYCFFPQGAQQARRQLEKGKRVMLGAVAVLVLAFLAALPFMFQSFRSFRLESILQEQRELSSAARADRQVVQNFEQRWGVITDFPNQDLVQMLFTLQSVLSPEQLTSLELSEGVISIEGESDEPQAILQRLETHPMFTEVIFSRATSNTRYYIDLRLSTVNFEGYMVRYFPEN